jgi:hypothetical protein
MYPMTVHTTCKYDLAANGELAEKFVGKRIEVVSVELGLLTKRSKV